MNQKTFKGGFRKAVQDRNTQTIKKGAALLGLIAFVVAVCVLDNVIGAGAISFAAMLPIWFKKGSGDVQEFAPLDDGQIKELSEEDKGRYYRALEKHFQDSITKLTQEATANKGNADRLKEIDLKLNKFLQDDFTNTMKILRKHGEVLVNMEKEGRTTKAPKSLLGNIAEWVEKLNPAELISKGSAHGMHKTTFKAPALMTVGASVLPNVAGGFSVDVNHYVDQEIAGAPKAPRFILNLVSVDTQNGAEDIWFSDRVNEEGDATFIGEGDLKPLIDAEYQTSKADIKEVAERWKMSNRMMKHTTRVVSDFREHADELIELKIDSGVLTGDGIGNNLSGVTTLAAAFVSPAGLANYYSDTNIYDVIHAIATQVMLANFQPTDVVLSTVWMAKMKGIKNSQGDYIVPPFVTPDGRTVSGLNITFTSNATFGDDDIIVGDLSKFKVVFSEDIMYALGWENDDFSKNLTSNKLEAFLGSYLKTNHVPAIVFDNISTVTTAITAL